MALVLVRCWAAETATRWAAETATRWAAETATRWAAETATRWAAETATRWAAARVRQWEVWWGSPMAAVKEPSSGTMKPRTLHFQSLMYTSCLHP